MDPQTISTTSLDQIAIVVAAFGIKPAYTVLSLLLIGVLWRSKEPDLRLLRWSLWSFFIGESFCAADFFFTESGQDWLEILHQLGMIGFGAMFPWSLFIMLDERMLHFSARDKTCLAQRFCGQCWKRESVTCGLQRIMLFTAPALAVLALIPMTSPVTEQHLLIPIYDELVPYNLSALLQVIMFRVYPALAIALLLLTFLLLLNGQRGISLAKWSFFWGLGFLSFALMRFALRRAFWMQPTWADAWEELTELIGIVCVAVILWSFRRPLGLARTKPTADQKEPHGTA